VISGFIIVYSSDKLFDLNGGTLIFLRRRLIRIVPLYWFSSTILITWVFFAYGGIGAVHWPLWTVAANYFFLPVGPGADGVPFLGIAWTLFYEMLFYVVFAIAMLTRSRAASVAVTAAVLMMLALIGLRFTLPLPFAYWSNPIIIEFIYGMLIALALRSGLRMGARDAWLLAALGLVLLLWSDMTFSSPTDTRWLARGLALGLPAAMVIAAAALGPTPKCDGRFWRFALFWGEASYAFYLMHSFAITLPRNLLGRSYDGAAHPYLYATAMIFTAFTIAAATHLLFERPITTLLRRGNKRTADDKIFATAARTQKGR
jgi:peptidoglycan/LPS O-acetylase OafA/YrhL